MPNYIFSKTFYNKKHPKIFGCEKLIAGLEPATY